MQQAITLYPKTDKNYIIFTKEYRLQKKEYQNFQISLSKKLDYPKELIRIINAEKGIGTEIFDNEDRKADNIAHYIAYDMDVEVLYTSGYWTNIISSWTNIHTQALQDTSRFANDFKQISLRLKDNKLYTDFVGRTTHYLTQQGKDLYIAAIAPQVLASGKMINYNGSLSIYLNGVVGSKATDLSIIENPGNLSDIPHKTTILPSSELAGKNFNKTMLIFYESGCGHCDILLRQLEDDYDSIKAKGIRILIGRSE